MKINESKLVLYIYFYETINNNNKSKLLILNQFNAAIISSFEVYLVIYLLFSDMYLNWWIIRGSPIDERQG